MNQKFSTWLSHLSSNLTTNGTNFNAFFFIWGTREGSIFNDLLLV